MAEEKIENKKQEEEKEKIVGSVEEKGEKVEEKKVEEKTEVKEEKKEIVKKVKAEKKDKAVVRGKDLSISTKNSMAICKFIKGKKIDRAMEELEKIIKQKKALPMKGELPHRRGMERGRYPINTSVVFIKLLKSLTANSSVAGIENPYIFIAKADRASRPHRRFHGRFKRTNVYLEAREKIEKENKEEVKEKKIKEKKEKK